MKLTATTSSFLLASMALSPSLSPSMVSAAPTGVEAPTSPNPLGSPNIRQFPPPPSAGSSPQTKHAPAFRTGPGSPRRSIPSRMLKVNKRGSPLDGIVGPVVGIVGPVFDPITGALKPIVGPVLDKLLPGIPVAGGIVSSVGTGLGIMGVNGQASSSSQPPAPPVGARNLADANSQWSDQAFDPLQTLGGIPDVGSLTGLAGSILPDEGQSPLGSLVGSLPLPGPVSGVAGALPQLSAPLSGIVGTLPQLPDPLSGVVGSLPVPPHPQFPGQKLGVPSEYPNTPVYPLPVSPSIPSNPTRGTPLARLIGWTPDGRPIVDIDGQIRELPAGLQVPRVPDVAGGPLSAESVSPSAPSPPGPPPSPSPHVTPPSPPASLPSSPASAPSPPIGPPSPPVSHAPGPPMTPSAAHSALPSPSAPVSPPAPPSGASAAVAAAVPTSGPPLLSPSVQEAPDGVLEVGQEDESGTSAAASSASSHSVVVTSMGTASAAGRSSSA